MIASKPWYQILAVAFPQARIEWKSDDGVHFHCMVESELFRGKSQVQCHRMVYSHLKPFFVSGELHAVQLETRSPPVTESQYEQV